MQGSWGEFIVGIMFFVVVVFVAFLGRLICRGTRPVYTVMTGARFNCFSDDQEVCAFIKNIPFGSVLTHYCQATLSSQLSSHVGGTADAEL